MVDRNGIFELSYTTPEVRLVQLEIHTSRAEFLVEPSKNYEFTISMDAELFNFFRPQDYDGFLQVKNEKADEKDLNHKVNYFTAYYNYAFNRYYFPIVYDRDEAARDSVLGMKASKRLGWMSSASILLEMSMQIMMSTPLRVPFSNELPT